MTGIITTLTLISNISYVLVVLLIIVDKRFREFVYRFVGQYPLQLIFLTSLVALVFSMVYSNVVNFPPCELCPAQTITTCCDAGSAGLILLYRCEWQC
jgi:hypothetical protein